MSTVLITGASSGIGAQLAKDYAADGWQVIACGRSPEKLHQLAMVSERITPLAFDVADHQATLDALGDPSIRPSLIILNAGTCEYIEHGEVDVALFRRVFDVNFFGVLNCLEALQPRFTETTHVAIVGSTAAYVPLPRAEAYGASKAAVRYLIHTLKLDLARDGVTFTLVSPGFVKTPLTDKNDFEMPMRVSTDYASDKIRKGIAKRKSEVHFPPVFSGFLKLVSLLPVSLQLAIIKRMTGKS
ncbi:SDR family NAD(P)-dependent oxidoreductase (plasmid) [Photobacterium sp. GJ3]|uniref:SDR family NAD(P)-dependent oxidoreductase n=1 Tax=Photobacterium sp. GJ3 TaxID=2829502 RepID=UPI001B8CFD86|nr:SDR family NAD(P)-dependent oxidoreductase [Photobacterium sp. GJ3]QUJ70578.1 SDR family NAD(P)-dependent oxidoreductase [Photobacterium sp. GJ3]